MLGIDTIVGQQDYHHDYVSETNTKAHAHWNWRPKISSVSHPLYRSDWDDWCHMHTQLSFPPPPYTHTHDNLTNWWFTLADMGLYQIISRWQLSSTMALKVSPHLPFIRLHVSVLTYQTSGFTSIFTYHVSHSSRLASKPRPKHAVHLSDGYMKTWL